MLHREAGRPVQLSLCCVLFVEGCPVRSGRCALHMALHTWGSVGLEEEMGHGRAWSREGSGTDLGVNRVPWVSVW